MCVFFNNKLLFFLQLILKHSINPSYPTKQINGGKALVIKRSINGKNNTIETYESYDWRFATDMFTS